MKKFYYLINIQFIGFRYSGWQKQTNAKTVQEMVDKTFHFIFDHDQFKTLGAGRTDAKVSANQFALELFVRDEQDPAKLLADLNTNLPADIRALDVTEVDESFKIINDPKIKEYQYIFTYGEKIHPFSAPLMVNFSDSLDINLMKEGAKLFEGRHNFKSYCFRPNPAGEFDRSVELCEIVENDLYTASFFPKESWILQVHGKGFMRQQIRLMVGALVRLGRGEITLEDISDSLISGETAKEAIGFVAPSSGLILNKVHFE
ncbi:tRNA pseudouridine(38-40) synthase TruA [Halobacteriovorax marinus]|uniref:tRNA pseudouridine synthase A n=1 Tax=Halobacteriovorax marinus TaxID=97084 RepID=A0A1Y5F9X2_9BACT|nr:tRNA pseudouridine(38-40) synthase TruA [Halobacteriovorax marinus]